ncbi:MAG: ATP-binding protein [Clostridia bacterium]|nr:ATP-binding protein [Clostridia bacterium]
MRLIPRRIKVKTEFFKNITLSDIIFAFIGIGVAIALFTANFEYHIWVAIGWVIIVGSMFLPVADGIRFYFTLGYLFRFFAQKKKFTKESTNEKADIKQIIPFVGFTKDRFIDFKDYFAEVIEVSPIEFGLLNEFKQNMLIDTFGNALRRLNEQQSATIVKLSKAMILDNFIYLEDKKYDTLMDLQYEGEMTPQEIEARSGIFEGRVSRVESLNRQEKVYKDYFYIVVYDKDKELLDTTVNGMISTLYNSVTPVNTRKLFGRDLVVFLKATFGKEFNERELEGISMANYMDWVIPKELKFRASGYSIDDRAYRQYVISDYPLQVGNAWGFNLFSQDRTKIIVKINPVQKYKAERNIDKAIMEMQSKGAYSARSSKQIENDTHVQTLKTLLVDLKNNNQQLYDVNIYVCCEDAARKEVKSILKQEGFKYSELFGRQVDGFISSNISMRDNVKETPRGMPTSTLAALFPFISGELQDKEGFYIGYNEYPVFIDFFTRNRERVNSNMIVVGKSGSGKSFATKTLLANFAADNTKIFILDPEDEYTVLAGSLKGKVIDVGSSAMGIINPFHIITSLKDDIKDVEEVLEEEDLVEEVKEKEKPKEKLKLVEATDTFSTHLQFVEQFFKVILEGIDSDSFEALNSLVVDMYNEKGIDNRTNLKELKPEDFPIFDDLYRIINDRLEKETNEYHKRNFLTIQTYIKKFSTGGRNSNLWNGPTSITTKENFVSFNFRSLLANRNDIIANAQMLLVFKYLDNEIIKNRDFNLKFKTNRKIVIAVDEAHVFINPDHPIALNFMAQMAKRIRKYNGMQIIITQNFKDFVGTPEIQRQSTAVINASQYSMIFALAPNDINDMVELYRKSGEINEQEQNSVVTAGLGQCFFISGPMSRTMLQIEAADSIKDIIE